MYSSKKLPKRLLSKAPGLKFEDVAIDAETVSLPVAATCPSVFVQFAATIPLAGQGCSGVPSALGIGPGRRSSERKL